MNIKGMSNEEINKLIEEAKSELKLREEKGVTKHLNTIKRAIKCIEKDGHTVKVDYHGEQFKVDAERLKVVQPGC